MFMTIAILYCVILQKRIILQPVKRQVYKYIKMPQENQIIVDSHDIKKALCTFRAPQLP